jgi:hypothetical protein
VNTGHQNVSIKEERLGFTCSAVTAADGTFVCLQMIWKGKTVASRARVQEQDLDPLILQCNQEESHFQNEKTWGELLSRIRNWFKKRLEAPEYAGKRGLFIFDHAPQHGDIQKVKDFFHDTGVDILNVPKKMTHVFQPADMFVISCLKSLASKAWREWVEETFARELDVAKAVDEVTDIGCATLKKQMKYEFLSQSIRALSRTESVVASWEASGVLRALGVTPRVDHDGKIKQPPLYDSYVSLQQYDAEPVADEAPQLDVEVDLLESIEKAEEEQKVAEKRGKGRPPGSKNKKPLQQQATQQTAPFQVHAAAHTAELARAPAARQRKAPAEVKERRLAVRARDRPRQHVPHLAHHPRRKVRVRLRRRLHRLALHVRHSRAPLHRARHRLRAVHEALQRHRAAARRRLQRDSTAAPLMVRRATNRLRLLEVIHSLALLRHAQQELWEALLRVHHVAPRAVLRSTARHEQLALLHVAQAHSAQALLS